MDNEERFWSRVDKSGGPDACWPWVGGRDRKGYGKYGSRIASRCAYEFAVGPIPDGLTIDHECFNPPCVNPAHLRPMTHSENSARKKEPRSATCPHGHAFTEANTYRYHRGGHDWAERHCRACGALRVRRYKERLRARVTTP